MRVVVVSEASENAQHMIAMGIAGDGSMRVHTAGTTRTETAVQLAPTRLSSSRDHDRDLDHEMEREGREKEREERRNTREHDVGVWCVWR